jgi:uncharacterized protein DUF5063
MAKSPTASRTSRAADEFHRLAQRYCRLVTDHRAIPPKRLLANLHQLIPALYASGLRLPTSTTAGDGKHRKLTHREWFQLFRGLRARLGNRDSYREVFDGYDRKDRDVVRGSLADDLADIFRDLSNGLQCWRAGDRKNAIREWRFGVDYHWGEHATSAMRALYWLRHDYEFNQPGAMPNSAMQRPVSRVTARARTKRTGRATRPRR